MLGPSWIPTKLSAEARSRPFEAPVITDFLANPGAERGRDIDKEEKGGNSKAERERERERYLMIATFRACIGAVREPRE